ncbi:MAG: AAA family ATPase [Nitrospirales bacterium]
MKNSRAHFTDLDCERSLLGGLLAEQKIPESLRRKIRAEAFSEQHRLTARALLSAFAKSGRCDILTVSEELVRLGGGLQSNDVLMRLAESAPLGADLDHLYGLVLERNGQPTGSDFMVPLSAYLKRKRDVPSHTVADFGWGPGGAMLAAAMGGLGKTLLMQSMALDLATDSPVLGRFPATKGENVGLFILEDPDGETAKRLTSILDDRNAENARLWVFDRDRENLTLGDKWGNPNERGFSVLEQAIGDLRLSVAIFDPLVNLHDANENDNSAMLRWLKPLRELCRRHRASVAISHHTTWGHTGQQHERGATAIRNWADTVLHMRHVQGEKGQTEHRRLSVTKVNFGRAFDPLILTIDPRTLRVTLDTEGAALCTVEDMLHLIREDLGGSWEGKVTDFYAKAASHFGASDKTIRIAFAGLKKKEGVVLEDLGRGKGFKLHEVAT